ncbi:hypothetical protein LOAG_18818 [Loa loa]|uniref:Uncharacterized protein n=1 Tax=Loa loa TaxID=7209 RepID=A0A1S0UE03_LOALO|nr:hypothetical protein LOAG_18818 [Loa loa]EJD73783.1 hypothetical protein LOAG_18818 [Loa loa]
MDAVTKSSPKAAKKSSPIYAKKAVEENNFSRENRILSQIKRKIATYQVEFDNITNYHS